jgi:hypothetical protein
VECTQIVVDAFEERGLKILKSISKNEEYSEEDRVEMIYRLRAKEWNVPTKDKVTYGEDGRIASFEYAPPQQTENDHLIISAIRGSD